MSARLFGRSAAAVFALSWGLMLPALAQNTKYSATDSTTNQTEQQPQPGKTGVPPRGTEVAPSTMPGQPNQPMTAQTGVEPRGTKVAPSTPNTSGEQNH